MLTRVTAVVKHGNSFVYLNARTTRHYGLAGINLADLETSESEADHPRVNEVSIPARQRRLPTDFGGMLKYDIFCRLQMRGINHIKPTLFWPNFGVDCGKSLSIGLSRSRRNAYYPRRSIVIRVSSPVRCYEKNIGGGKPCIPVM